MTQGPWTTLEHLAGQLPAGALLAIAPDYSGCAMAALREVIRAGTGGLRLVTVPQGGLQADLLIGAGLVASVESAAVTLGEYGLAPRFTAAVKSGAVEVRDSTCPAIHAGLQAAEKGIPFMALRGVLGSDLMKHRGDWTTIDNPFAEGGDPILLLPAIKPEVALFHAPLADREGNVWIGVRRELMLMAHAAQRSLVTVERVQEESLLADPKLAAGTIPALYITALAEARRGADPVGLFGCYEADRDWLARYAREAKSAEGFAALLAEWLAETDEPSAAHG